MIIWYADDLDDRALHKQLVEWHRMLGISILALMLLRWIFHAFAGKPKPAAINNAMKWLVKGVHSSFYLALFCIPMLGWAMTNAFGKPVMWLSLTLPTLVQRDRDLAENLQTWHSTAAEVLLITIALHALAGLYHQYVQKHASASRMLPQRSTNISDK